MKIEHNTDNYFKANLRCKTCKTCPDLTIDVENDLVQFDDDYGNTNIWTLENFRSLAANIKEGQFDKYL